jgi:hypothetical protein
MVVLPAFAADEGVQGLNIDDFMKTGMVSHRNPWVFRVRPANPGLKQVSSCVMGAT